MKRDPAEGGTIKTSTILIAAGRRTAVYRRIEEVPPILRRLLVKSTGGPNAGTVVIADRRGARELLRANVRALLQRERRTRTAGLLALLREDLSLLFNVLLVYRRWVGAALLLAAAALCLVLSSRL